VLRADPPEESPAGDAVFTPVKTEQRLARCANRHQFIANAVEMDEPADEVIFVVRLRGLRVA